MSQIEQVAFAVVENATNTTGTGSASQATASRDSTLQFDSAMKRVDGMSTLQVSTAASNKAWDISFSADGAMDSFRKWMQGLSDRMTESGDIMSRMMEKDLGMKDLTVMVQKLQNINIHFQSAMECVKLSGEGFQSLVHKGSQ